jgi:hypothetical protein
MIVTNVPAGVCHQCGEKYFKPDILKKMDSAYHGIFERRASADLGRSRRVAISDPSIALQLTRCGSFRCFENSRSVEVRLGSTGSGFGAHQSLSHRNHLSDIEINVIMVQAQGGGVAAVGFIPSSRSRLSRSVRPSSTCGCSADFQTLNVFINLRLQLPELLQRTLREQGEVTWVLGQNFVAVGFKDTLHPSHLLDGLVKFFGCLNHNFILKMPFFTPGLCLTC